MLHIGNRIKEVFDQQPKQHTIDWLADKLNCQRANVYKIFNRQDIDSGLLGRLCYILEHDFFADLSRDYNHNIRVSESTNEIALHEFHDEMMLSISRMLSRHLNRLPSDLVQTEYGAVINRLEDLGTSLSPLLYEVKVYAHEMRDMQPHIHLRSKDEKYDLRIGIESGKQLSVKNYGIYDSDHRFADIIFAASYWLDQESKEHPGLTNRDIARLFYRFLNP